MKTYTIIGGVNGTGKSSLTGVLRTEMNDLGKIIDVDKLNIEYGSTIEGGKAAIKIINDCLEKEICFTQETTLSGHKTVSTAKAAAENGYFIRLYYIGLDTAEESIKRIKNRVSNGGHSIPENDVIRRFQSRFKDISAILPYCNEATFYDNKNGFRAIARFKNGDFEFIGHDCPEWLQSFIEYYNK